MRNSADFEEYVYEKSRNKIAQINMRKRLAVSAAVVCLIAGGGFGTLKTLNNIPFNNISNGADNAVMYEEDKSTDSNVSNEFAPSISNNTPTESTLNSCNNDDFNNSYSFDNDSLNEDFEENVYEDDFSEYAVSTSNYFYDAIKNKENEFCTPHFAEIYENDSLISIITDTEIIKNLCITTLSQFNGSESEPVSTSEKYTVIIGYSNTDNTDDVVIQIANQTVTTNCGDTFDLTDDYLKEIKSLLNN